VPGHTGIQGNERADKLARQASSQTFVGQEPVLPIPYSMVKTAFRDWAYSLMDWIIDGRTSRVADKQEK